MLFRADQLTQQIVITQFWRLQVRVGIRLGIWPFIQLEDWVLALPCSAPQLLLNW
jgi:hypothetical protein